jgi:hypothetical protein
MSELATVGQFPSSRPLLGTFSERLEFGKAYTAFLQVGHGLCSPPRLATIQQTIHLGKAMLLQVTTQLLGGFVRRTWLLRLEQVIPGGAVIAILPVPLATFGKGLD